MDKNYYIKFTYILIFMGLVYSIANSIKDTIRYDKFRIGSNSKEAHSIVRSDIDQYWRSAIKFKRDIEKKKSFFKSGGEIKHSYLYPRFIASYFLSINQNIKENNRYVLNNYKFGIPIIQSLIYYFLLILLLKKLINFFGPKISMYIVGFLSIEPTILQYHSSYWTESIYFSFLILLIYFLLDVKKSLFFAFIVGLIVGISALQRNVSLYLIVPILIYLIIIFKKDSIKPILTCMIGYFLIIFFIGYSNFQRSGDFFVIPFDQKDGPYSVLAHILNGESNEDKYLKRKKWIEKNSLNLENPQDKLRLADYQHNYFKKSLIENPVSFIKIHIWKSFQGLILNPFETNNAYSNDKTVKNYWEKWRYQLFYQIPYSILIYLICFIGFATLFNKNRNISIMILLVVGYYISILGWIGVSRYMSPNLIFLSIFFGYGINDCVNFISKRLNNF